MLRNYRLTKNLRNAGIFSAGIATGLLGVNLGETFVEEVQPGHFMATGEIYAGTIRDTQKTLYTTPQDAEGLMNWYGAQTYCSDLVAHNHNDWRVPTIGELGVMFNNRAAIGNFNETGLFPAGWYWSSTEGGSNAARSQRFSDGLQGSHDKRGGLAVRCVR